ncbi:uncharacterized protein LOC134531987 [Bacillus rossius redtenbacheri]|uniref:uncharacterized protein LOC134531987 n=1 Tax=Bacillus rossius redtenbacheri TaxID=93214 RepID=UPI002FDEA620
MMIRACLVAAIATVACAAGIYPIHRHVLFDPRSYDLLYNSSKGAVTESWYLTTASTLTGFVLPSRLRQCLTDDVYDEEVSVAVTRVASPANLLVASGRFAGRSAHGGEVYVSLLNATSGEYPKLASGVNYFVKISLSAGLYPWHLNRPFSSIAGFHSICNAAGYIIGVEYTR